MAHSDNVKAWPFCAFLSNSNLQLRSFKSQLNSLCTVLSLFTSLQILLDITSLPSLLFTTQISSSSPWISHQRTKPKAEKPTTTPVASQPQKPWSTEMALVAKTARNANWSDCSEIWRTHQPASVPPILRRRWHELRAQHHLSLTYISKMSVHVVKYCMSWWRNPFLSCA